MDANSDKPDTFANASSAQYEIRSRYNERRFLQLNTLLVGHVEGTMQYLLTVNGGGAVSILALVGAVEKWRAQNWPYWVLSVFVVGLILAGVLRVIALMMSKNLVQGWIQDISLYHTNGIEWKALTRNDRARVNGLRWLPWLVGWSSLACFIGGTIASGVFIFRAAP